MRTLGTSFFIMVLGLSIAAQSRFIWIGFKDKPFMETALQQPEKWLTKPALERRDRQKIAVSITDIPVNEGYLKQFDCKKGFKIKTVSKWLNGLVLEVSDAGRMLWIRDSLLALPHILEVLDIPAKFLHLAHLSFQTQSSGNSRAQLRQLGVHCLHEHNFRGQNMRIAVMDVGFIGVLQNAVFDSLLLEKRLKGTYNFVSGETNVFKGGSHGTMVLSCLAGNLPETVLGTAPKAQYWLFNTEDGASETLLEEYHWIRAAEYADSVGVDIITTSLGYTEFDDPQQNHRYADLNGRTAPMSRAATMAARKGILVINAAGNEGNGPWKYISVPADADSIIAVGAVDTTGKAATFSGYGPSSDGRIKPDLAACGWGTWICDGTSNCFYGNGTSFAAPLLAGAAACYWQQHPFLNNMQLKASIQSRANSFNAPNNRTGWGVPNLCMPLLDLDFSLSWLADTKTVRIRLEETYYSQLHLKIYNAQGQTLFDNSLNTGLWMHDLTFIRASGLYIFEIASNRGTLSKKLIVP